jgi:hypothetical protein
MRFIPVALGLLIGFGTAIIIGRVIWPVEYADVTPEYLSAEVQTDYAIMTATAYDAFGDLDLARQRLSRLGPDGSAILLNAILAERDNPAIVATIQRLAAELGLYDSSPPEE